jgi:hypothetical protein
MSEFEHQPGRIEFDDELRRCLRADPFHPFDVVTASGVEYQITDSVQMAIGNTAIVIVLPKTGVQIIRKAHITAVHVREPA